MKSEEMIKELGELVKKYGFACAEDNKDIILDSLVEIKFFFISSLSRQKEELKKVIEAKYKRIDFDGSADSRRYPYGYNTALTEILKEIERL